mmetsp:Transcript_28693/g.54175  ORF Transcript_28693/g.54175 Transcript_28693/m.54175 type:complete len:204 (+) Transcript_28693:217-828(+)
MVVLMTASVEAIFEAMERSFAMNTAMQRVLATAKRRHMMAFVKERPTPSLSLVRPAWDWFIMRSPMNIVAALEKKSEPTMVRAVLREPEYFREVMRVTVPAITRQDMDLTAERAVDSLTCSCIPDSSMDLPSKYESRRFSRRFSLFSITSSDATCFSRLIVSTVRIFSIRLRSEDAESPVVELIAVDGMAVLIFRVNNVGTNA